MSDVGNYLYAGGPMVGPRSHCRNPPDPPKPVCLDCTPTPTCINCPPLIACSADAFSSWEGHVDGVTIVEHMTVRTGFDGIVAYLVSWAVPAFREGTNLPLPQERVHLTTQELHVGENVMTAPLASPAQAAGWQWEWGCELPPLVLTEENLRSWAYLDSGWGNFGGQP